MFTPTGYFVVYLLCICCGFPRFLLRPLRFAFSVHFPSFFCRFFLRSVHAFHALFAIQSLVGFPKPRLVYRPTTCPLHSLLIPQCIHLSVIWCVSPRISQGAFLMYFRCIPHVPTRIPVHSKWVPLRSSCFLHSSPVYSCMRKAIIFPIMAPGVPPVCSLVHFLVPTPLPHAYPGFPLCFLLGSVRIPRAFPRVSSVFRQAFLCAFRHMLDFHWRVIFKCVNVREKI